MPGLESVLIFLAILALLKSGIEMSAGQWMGLTFATYLRYLGHLLLAYTLGYARVFMLGRFIH